MLNQIVVMGRLTRDPEVKVSPSGLTVVNFSIACDRDYADQSGAREVDFLDIVAWRKTAEFIAKFFQKGSMIVVQGRLQVRQWKDKEGHSRKTAEIVADHAYFGESKKAQSAPSPYGGNAYPESEAALNRYGIPPVQPGNEYPQLTDDDPKLPF